MVHYASNDLYHWDYQGVLIEGAQYGTVIECPDFFKFGDRYVLMFSQMDRPTHAAMFLTGAFDGTAFTPETEQSPEAVPQFYASQSFEAPDGWRIVIGWLYDWKKELDEDATTRARSPSRGNSRWTGMVKFVFSRCGKPPSCWPSRTDW